MRNPTTPSLMEPRAAIDEINAIRDRMEQDARRIYELSRSIHQYARRAPSDVSSAYLMYANTWTRFAGMVDQGLRRTTTPCRVVTSTLEKVAREEEARSKENKPPIQRQAPRGLLPPNDDMVELFGEDLVNA